LIELVSGEKKVSAGASSRDAQATPSQQLQQLHLTSGMFNFKFFNEFSRQ